MTDMLYDGKALIDMLREQIDASKGDPPNLHGALIRQRQAQMRASPFAESIARLEAAGKVVAQTYVGAGGGGNASPNQATAGFGGGGGLSFPCQLCGAPATRLVGGIMECGPCSMRRRGDQQHDAHVRARAAQPTEPAQPERRFCACGQELFRPERGITFCGDCLASKPGGALPDRIAAAQKPDADPTQAWGAGATPSYDWEGR